jgi:putative tryptophan/tyrosine transport system substrate-binding protein
MRRRDFVAGLGSAAAWPLAARAQQPAVPVVGYLVGGGQSEDDPDSRVERDAFEKGLGRLGWVVGRNLTIDYRAAGGDGERMRELAADIVGRHPQVIVSRGTQASLILKRQTSSVPIVFLNVADPVESGLVESFPHPGGNVTGFASVEFSLGGKWLSVLKDIAPSLAKNI